MEGVIHAQCPYVGYKMMTSSSGCYTLSHSAYNTTSSCPLDFFTSTSTSSGSGSDGGGNVRRLRTSSNPALTGTFIGMLETTTQHYSSYYEHITTDFIPGKGLTVIITASSFVLVWLLLLLLCLRFDRKDDEVRFTNSKDGSIIEIFTENDCFFA